MERRELTSGSTWHAAGLLPLFNMSYSVGQIHNSSVELYRTLEAEMGQDVGLRLVGNIKHVVSATGSFVRRTGAMAGPEVPVIPVQHQYIVTEPHPATQARHAAGLAEMGVLREPAIRGMGSCAGEFALVRRECGGHTPGGRSPGRDPSSGARAWRGSELQR